MSHLQHLWGKNLKFRFRIFLPTQRRLFHFLNHKNRVPKLSLISFIILLKMGNGNFLHRLVINPMHSVSLFRIRAHSAFFLSLLLVPLDIDLLHFLQRVAKIAISLKRGGKQIECNRLERKNWWKLCANLDTDCEQKEERETARWSVKRFTCYAHHTNQYARNGCENLSSWTTSHAANIQNCLVRSQKPARMESLHTRTNHHMRHI